MNKQTFKNGLGLLVSCFPGKDFNSKAYWELLNDLNDDKYLKAVKEVCQSQPEIYPGTNIIALIRRKANYSDRLLACEAWEKILKARRKGYWRVGRLPDFKDSVINKAVDCTGWQEILDSDKISIERAYFIKTYDQLLDRELKNKVLALPVDKQALLTD